MRDKHQRRQERRQQKQARADAVSSPVHFASSLFQTGKTAEAGDILEKFLSDQPESFDALALLGVVRATLGDLDAAIPLFEKADRVRPDDTGIQINLAKACEEQGRPDDAIGYYRRSLEIEPGNEACLITLGNLLNDKNDITSATVCFKRALEINPGNAWVHSNLGNVLVTQGLLDDAVESHQRALEIDSGNALIHSNLGIALKAQGLLDDALASHIRALEIDPNIASIHNNLGYALEALGRLNEAVASYRKALTIKPEYADAHNNLGGALLGLGKLDEAVASYREAVAIMPNFDQAQSNLIFSLNYIAELSPADLFSETCRFGAMVAARAKPVVEHSNNPAPDRRLRIGLVSGDFRNHSVGFFLETILSEIEKEKLEIFAYATSGIEDDLTARIKKNVSQWRSVKWMDDGTLAAKIIEDGIDILVDLSGHTAHNRLSLFSMKPAPIQVTWLGFSATTGVDAIDYILCDKWVIPPGEEGQFVEKPWRLPDAYLCFSPPDLKVDIGPSPVQANSYITFGCFNNLSKVTDTVMSYWAEVLRAVPDSRLFLKAKQLNETSVQEDVLSRFARYGLSSELLILKGHSKDRAAHLTNYNLVDIALDPFPYAGTTTSIEALWMGTPLLTLQGDRFISRVGASILRNMGHGEWVGESPQDYIKKAIVFASDLPVLSSSREGLRQRLLDSSVCDAPRFARNMENAFRGMWRDWCVAKNLPMT